jgi:hypothetical protein
MKRLDKDELAAARSHLDNIDPGTPMQAAAIDAVLGHADALEADLGRANRALARARDVIAVLYVGKKARLPDGRVDVDAVINGVLGEES